MRHLLLALLLVLQPPRGSQLEGLWRLDVKHSVLTGGLLDHQDTLEQTLRIEIAGDEVSVATATSGLGNAFTPQPTTERFHLDGLARTERWGGVAGQTRRRTANWQSDESFQLIDEFAEGRIVQRWALSDDMNVLTVDYVSTTGPGLRRYFVFRRQRS